MNFRTIVFLLLLPLLVAGCAGDSSPAEEPAPVDLREVETATVQAVDYRHTIFATGKLAARQEARLSFKTGGIIKQVYVAEGQAVRKGQLLAELDLEEVRARTRQAGIGTEQAQIQLENARLALQLAERDYRNALGLYQDSVATLEQLENAEVQLDNARNQLEAAEAGLSFSRQNEQVADFNLKYSRIVAPADGSILKKLAEPNELVGPGSPVFLFGSQGARMVIRVNVTDKDIIFIDLGDQAEVRFDAYPADPFPGMVSEVASMADPYTNTYEVEIEVNPSGKKLLSGFIGAVDIFTDAGEPLAAIPVAALLSADEDLGEVFVFQDGRALKTQVTIFRLEGDRLLIRRGLNPGDEVIVSGVGYLEDEDSVMIVQR